MNMMRERPHQMTTVPALRALAENHWADRPRLESIAQELALRAGTAASLLLGAVQARVRELPAATSETDRLRQSLEEERARSRRAESEASRLRQRLAAESAGRLSDEEVATLRRQLDDERWRRVQAAEEAARLRQWVEARQPGAARDSAAYAELHLAPDVPDDLLEALHKAYQKHYHPDRATASDRERATRRFQAIQRAFAAIRQARGLD